MLWVLVLGSFVSTAFTGSPFLPERPRVPIRHFRGIGSLPFSGDFGDFGRSFRRGFEQGLASLPDSVFDWSWRWTDNEGDPDRVRDLVRSPDTGAVLLVGVSSVASGLTACSSPCLVLGDGSSHRADAMRWDLWTPDTTERARLLALLKSSDPPRAVVVEASGAWTTPVFPALSDSLPGLLVLLHDPDNARWDDAVQQLLELRPRTVLFWDSPADASSLLSRRLAWPVFRQAKLWVPEGASVPAGVPADTLRPLWQAVAGDSASAESWKNWGWNCGRALAMASRRRVLDTLVRWNDAFRKVPPSSGLQVGATGWYPGTTEHGATILR